MYVQGLEIKLAIKELSHYYKKKNRYIYSSQNLTIWLCIITYGEIYQMKAAYNVTSGCTCNFCSLIFKFKLTRNSVNRKYFLDLMKG